MLERFDQMNLFTYLFRAPVLYDALSRLKSSRSSQEEYLTDVFEILAHRKQPARVAGCEIQDVREIQWRSTIRRSCWPSRMSIATGKDRWLFEAPANRGETLALAGKWDALLQDPSVAAKRQFRQWYGDEVPWQQIRNVLGAFIQRYGADRQVAIVRSPGRIT